MKKFLLFVALVSCTVAVTVHAQEKNYIVGDELAQFIRQPFSVTRARDQVNIRFTFKNDGVAYQNVTVVGEKIRNFDGTWQLNPKQTLVCTTWNFVDAKNWCFGYYHDGDSVKMYTYGGPNNPHIDFGTVK